MSREGVLNIDTCVTLIIIQTIMAFPLHEKTWWDCWPEVWTQFAQQSVHFGKPNADLVTRFAEPLCFKEAVCALSLSVSLSFNISFWNNFIHLCMCVCVCVFYFMNFNSAFQPASSKCHQSKPYDKNKKQWFQFKEQNSYYLSAFSSWVLFDMPLGCYEDTRQKGF